MHLPRRLRRGIERHGKDSRSALFHLCALKQAVVETSGEDRFGRTLGRVTCAGVDANAQQVRQGCVQ